MRAALVGKNKEPAAHLSAVFAVDLHTHSRFFHRGDGPTRFDPIGLRLVTVAARLRGLDGVALTNHDYTYSAESTLPVIPGIEVSTTMGHVLVVGPDPPSRSDPGVLTPEETVELAHERGCAAILAHPFRHSVARESGADFDAVELNGKNPEHIERTVELAKTLDLSLVGGSDAHYPVEIGRAYTRVDVAELTPANVVDAIRDGAVDAVVELGRLGRLLDRGYTASHTQKGWME